MNLKPISSQWNKPKLAAQSCATCNAFLPNKAQRPIPGQAQVGWCRANPPVAAQVMVANPLSGQPTTHWQGVFSPTMADYWCRNWEGMEDDGPTAAA